MRVALSLSSDQQTTATAASEAEASGFDAVASGEHLFFHGPTGNAFISLAAAAGATTRIRLISSLTVLPLYQAVIAIKLATSLDQVSAGRFDFGVGVGGEFPPEFRAAGIDRRTRGARTDEALELARRLWSDTQVTHHGRFFDVPGLTLEPGPVQPGGPPVWIGGRSTAAMRRAGRHADVWLPYMFTPEQLAESLTVVRAEAERVDRDPAQIRAAVFCFGSVNEDAARARRDAVQGVSSIYQQDFERLADRYLLHGTPTDVLNRALEYRAAGAETLVLAPVPGPGRADTVETFASEVLPHLQR